MAIAKRRRKRTAGGVPSRTSHRRGKRGLYWFCALLVVACVAVVLSLTVFFRIEKISVDTGDTPYTSDEISAACGITTGKNLWLADTKKAAEAIEEKFPYAETVTVRRRIPAALEITLNGPEIEVTADNGTTAKLISGRGRVLGEAGDGTRYLIEGAAFADGRLDAESLEKLDGYDAIYRALAEYGLTENTGVICVKSLSEVYFTYDGRIKVELGGLTELEHKAAFFYKFITEDSIEGEVGVFNVSDSEKAYFRPVDWRDSIPSEPDAGNPDTTIGASGTVSEGKTGGDGE